MKTCRPEADTSLEELEARIGKCTLCAPELPLGPRPVVRLGAQARVLIIGQAPGTRVHASGVPWDDASGIRLRQWLALNPEQFYDRGRIAIMPMGFCYPGKAKGGDLPPRSECAPKWHAEIRSHLKEIRLTLLIGRYALNRYLPESRGQTLEDRVRQWPTHLGEGFFPLPHPSPRNTLWIKKRPWFEAEVIPALQGAVWMALETG